jgi:peptidoglycan L-alanyl-D-glutamate endopeptidase CwlK
MRVASRKINDLIPEMREKAEKVVQRCADQNVDLLIYCTLRSLEEQARLYRKTRTRWAIEQKMNSLKARGFAFLAEILAGVGPQEGPLGRHVTCAGPGESWHNYARAFDAVPLVDGKEAWDVDAFAREWEIYGEAAEAAGLQWAGRWVTFKEYPHAQLPQGSNPLKEYDYDAIRSLLKELQLV